ncbi:hypothetical protein MVEN_01177000 [Mycena venus]|uniref:Uncharacterized protein n=1 Tax=Mycena venus TaxID=2733690 RepID=A0A8H7CYJ2_9AGAR|nr:hypothetical protein MVEN_01177000 [Mycena venus]
MATNEVTIVVDAADFVSVLALPAGVIKSEALIFLELNMSSPEAVFKSYNDTLAIMNSSLADSEYIVHFEGQSIAAFGIAPPSNFAPPSTLNTSFFAGFDRITYPAPGLEGQWYNATQNSVISDAYGLILDYALVTPGGTTNLQGSTIFLDDSNPEIKWDHNWNSTLHTPATWSTEYPRDVIKGLFTWHRTPHNNGTHESSTVGASFAFQFAGTSILISGVSPSTGSNSSGVLVMSFTLDGTTTTQHYFVGQDTNFPVDLTFHFPYFQNDSLPSGNHTLTATIVDVVGNATASIDYITYRPNFALLSEKPVFPDLPSVTGINGTGTSPSATPPPITPTNTHTKPRPIGAIVGGTIAGAVLVVALLFGLWYRQKRRRLRSNKIDENDLNSTFVEPFSPGTLTRPVYHESKSKIGLQTVTSLPSPSSAAISPTDDPHAARSAFISVGTEPQSAVLNGGSNPELHTVDRAVTTSGTADNGQLEEHRIREIVAAEINRLMQPPAYD